VGLVLVALLSAIAWRTSETKATTANVPYRETGTFTYSARAPKGPVYQHEIETGDPVFLKLVTDVKVNYEYRLDLDASHNIAGTTAMVAVISQQNGWTRRIRLAPSQSFTGDSAQLSGNLDLERVVKKLHMVEQLTGQEADLYQLDLIAHTEVEGEIQGSRFSDTFDSSLPMQLDDTTVQMAPSDSETADQLSSSRSQSLPVPATRDTQLSLGPLDLSVSSARLVGPIGAGACLLLILVFGIPLLGAYRKDEASRIHARYGPLLVPMRSVSGIEGAMAEVDDMEALVRIADRYDRLVLHENREGVHRYIVEGDGVVYVYRAKEEASA
jgi:hypothetical protein